MIKLSECINNMRLPGIGRRLALWILAFSSVVTLVFTGLQLAIEFKRDMTGIESGLNQIRESYSDSLASSLWVTSQKDVQLQLDGVFRLPNMQYLEVRDENDKIVAMTGMLQERRILRQETSLYFEYRGKQVYTGKLIAIASLEGAYQHLKDKIVVILLSQSVKTFLVSFFILFLFQALVGRHLRKIAQHSGTLDAGLINQLLALDRKPSPGASQDELDQLVHSFNTMSQRLETAYRKLQQSEENIRLMVESVQDYAILRLDPLGGVTSWNLGVERIFGYHPDEFIGKPHTLFFTPEDIASGKPEQLLHEATTLGRCEEEGLRVRQDGSSFNAVDLITALYDPQGILRGFSKVTRDITERKRAEDELRFQGEIMTNMAEAVYLVRMEDGIIVYTNSVFENMFGYGQGEMIGRHVSIVNAPTEQDPVETAKSIMVTIDKKGSWQGEVCNVRKDGTYFWCYASVSEFKHSKYGRVLVAVHTNITKRKRAEIELEKHRLNLENLVKERTTELVSAKETAEAASRAKSAFLANMSHELRTPLNAVLGFSRLLNNDPLATTEQKANLSIITRSGEHLLQLINNVLDISKIEAGHVELEEVDFDLLLLVREMQSMMYAQTSEKTLYLQVEPSPDLPPHVTCDQGKLRQVLINLLGNAVKFTKSGGVTLRVGLVQGEESQQVLVRFEVADTGPGMSEEEQERIFHPFVQVGEQPATEVGTGLGLLICKQYVELMGGRIGVQSTPGQGSVFSFEIPVGIPVAVKFPATLGRGRIIGLSEGQPRYRLLIADDQPDNLLLLYKLLEPLGFELRSAVNGQEAVAIFNEWHPHLIWMDIRMPVMDGLEATRRIKATESGSRTPVIALTAHALEKERREILAAGCEDLLHKPFREEEFFEAMARHLGVRYEYAERQEPVVVPERELQPEQLAALPAEILGRLHQAVVELDTSRTMELIAQITLHDASAGTTLQKLARRLDYRRLLRLLEDTETVSPTPKGEEKKI